MQRPFAKKSLGQNYLRDGNIIRKIVAALEAGPDDRVLEIGPGPGALSRDLAAARPASLILVEKDYRWAFERNREFFASGGPGQTAGLAGGVVLADAMTIAWERLDGERKIIGNLPYNIASPLMWEIFSRVPGFCGGASSGTRAVFMVQKEVGQRLAARPGTKEYGALSVWVQSFVTPKLEFIVPPTVFYPRPKVDSAVLTFTPRAPEEDFPLLDAEDKEALAAALRLTFQQRRKQLGTILKKNSALSDDFWSKVAQNSATRPENISPRDFLRLAREIRRLSLASHVK